MERLQKIIARSGYCSRRKAEELISQGRVSVNGTVVSQLGVQAEESDEIRIDGILLNEEEEKVVYLLNKPKNVISSANDDRGRKTVVDLIDSKHRLYPLGRLDYDSSGLILLSNDGEKNREIRKMFETIGCKVIRLHRIREANIGLGNLKSGEYRRLKPHEVKKLREYLDRNDR